MAAKKLKCKSLIVKVASLCNLNCSYCYMYNMGDLTYKNQPKYMSGDITSLTLKRAFEHISLHGISDFRFIFHGGEPLLVGKSYYRDFIRKAKELFKNSDVELKFSVQTNGVLIDKEWCELFNELKISVGVSIDGTKEDNDTYRKDHSGKGSYVKVIKGLNIAQNYLHKGVGLLSVININADPVKTYNHLKGLNVSSLDFLLPDANYTSLPPLPKKRDKNYSSYSEYYSDWLISVFDEWFKDEDKNRPSIRFFEYILHLLFGGRATLDSLGTEDNEALVIETDGSIEALDVLKICGNGFTKDNAHVRTHSFDDALNSDLARLYNQAHNNLCGLCSKCDLKSVCGGGNLPHRYNPGNGFDNPSIYCKTLAKVIIHIQNMLLWSLPIDVRKSLDIEELNYDYFIEKLNSDRKKMYANMVLAKFKTHT